MSSQTPEFGPPLVIEVYLDNKGTVTGVSNKNPTFDPPGIINWVFPRGTKVADYPFDFDPNSQYFKPYVSADQSTASFKSDCPHEKSLPYSIGGPKNTNFDPSIDNRPTGD